MYFQLSCKKSMSCLHKAFLNSNGNLVVRALSTQATPKENIYWNDRSEPGESTFKKILIANRGEIACRVIETCRRLGIATVAIHSDVDSNALYSIPQIFNSYVVKIRTFYQKFVHMADEAFCIGPAPVNQSYLNMEAILDVVKKTGSEAVHPGYGFLSENMKFAKMLEDAGSMFIGPTSFSIKAMGDKIESKRFALKAKVNMIPGFDGEVKDEDHAVKVANDIGYPVMIKASAGGGGRGLRIAWNDKECRSSYKISKTEAASTYGDDRMLIEKYIDNPRHIEVQVMCDAHGNAVYLNERECSIQRRNQKVIEEAPSTFIDPETRKQMGEQACMLARSVQYSSAGTVEFLVDSKRKFYFLEMNTRLQDPYKNFGIPSIGRLSRYIEPTHLPNVRCDSGITEGSDISVYYDSMICKLVTYGKTRDDALKTMAQALDTYVIRGVKHNIPLLRDVVTEERFVKGDISTKYLFEVYPNGFQGKMLKPDEKLRLVGIASCVKVKDDLINIVDNIAKGRLDRWTFESRYGEESFKVDIKLKNKVFHVKVNEQEMTIADNFNLSTPVLNVLVNGQPELYQLIANDVGHVKVQYEGTVFEVNVLERHVSDLQKYMPKKVKIQKDTLVIAPMSGVVKSVAVKVGDVVAEGQEVLVLEAMKMQNSLTAAIQGKIKKLNVKVGATVSAEDVLIELE
ncbi:hypothetical protein HELRODRAFT_188188 [Helobdella robusta]|uniref:Propionyl-CoA carboxylase alpha chain, mitochondrial n=1 Tax=Helobdella robusta TaxID=6412 RepID=T1FPR4_HELRO|nr:hypothetical protein HELRODRAFT_188188 [Helobdella robusta]ESO05820.1 hypothetical protein HELRODRAFT_188188 [Helobdella robusta]